MAWDIDMGRRGYSGKDARVRNHDFTGVIGGHSDWFLDPAWLVDTVLLKHGRRDANHQAIKDTFIALGCSVADTADVGNGFPDLVVVIGEETVLVEVKTLTELAPMQRRMGIRI